MGDKTKIEWSDATWNFLAGCKKVSAGCKNCYAIRDAHRLAENPNAKVSAKYKSTTVAEKTDAGVKLNWSNVVNLDEEMLVKPLQWTRPRKIFVNSMSDLFHESVKDEWIDKAFAVMALTPQHTYQILTKRPERMKDYVNHLKKRYEKSAETNDYALGDIACDLTQSPCSDYIDDLNFPFSNVWLGVSVEDQKAADERIPHLLETPAAVRFLSVEPLLGKINFMSESDESSATFNYLTGEFSGNDSKANGIDWVIAGGESGASARPVHPDWIRSIRDQCVAANVPFFFKQWGTWGETWGCDDPCSNCVIALKDGTITGTDWLPGKAVRDGIQLHPMGKKKSGRMLDGRTWDEIPKSS